MHFKLLYLDACNAEPNCQEADPSDEMNCTCSSNEFACDCFKTERPTCPREKGCIDKSKVNDGNLDCESGNDEPSVISIFEESCDSCSKFKIFRLKSKEGCTKMKQGICNNNTCKAVPSINCNSTNCDESYDFVCLSNCLSSEGQIQSNCTNFFICENGDITLGSNFCDGKPECSDSSDEIQNEFGFKCQRSREILCVLPQDNLDDEDTPQCSEGIDVPVLSTKGVVENLFMCLDNSYKISIRQVCDSILDCPDLSDECLCPINLRNPLCKTRFENSNVSVPGQYTCGAVNTGCSKFKSIHIKETGCGGDNIATNTESINPDTIQCQAKYRIVDAEKCDDIPECSNLDLECLECSPKPEFCHNKCNDFYLMGDRYCNGFEDLPYNLLNETECPKGFDETEKNCKKRFHCKAGKQVNIPLSSVNDGVVDCDNGEDEAGRFSSSTKMIRDDAITAFIWIIAIVTLSGNGYVIYSTTHLLRNKKMHDLLRANHILVLNLSIADFIMGIYLLIVSIKNLEFMGIYGTVDLEWRSGFTCTLSGVLAIISSETSCFIMSTLSTFRLVNIMRPLKSLSYPTWPWFTALVFVWLSSFVLAILPSLDLFEDYFVYQLYFNVSYAKNRPINKTDILDMSCRYASTLNHSFIQNDSWEVVVPYLKGKFNATVEKISYYGETSLCMPRFYANKNDPASTFSIFIISLNFISFVYVCLSYIFIYKVTSNRPVSNKQVDIQNAKMQKRIARLLVTDFICWIPICVIAFANYLNDISLTDVVYAITIAFLLPVNSALNPLLYSSFFDNIFEKINKCRDGYTKTKPPPTSSPQTSSQTKSDLMKNKAI